MTLSMLLPHAGFFALGLIWQWVKFFDLPAAVLRRHINALVFSLLLPAYTLSHLWHAKLSMNMVITSAMILFSVLICFTLAWFWLKGKRWAGPTKGGMLLAAVFPAVFALGIPVVSATTGIWAQRLAIETGALVILPLLFTLGSHFAYRLGDKSKQALPKPLMLHQMPMFWAVVAGLGLNYFMVAVPVELNLWLKNLSAGVFPLLLVATGASLRWNNAWGRFVLKILPLFVISLIIAPLLVWLAAQLLDYAKLKTLTSLIVLAGLPAMTLGFTICERYRLDVTAYNLVFSATSLLSLVTIPAWIYVIQTGWLPLR